MSKQTFTTTFAGKPLLLKLVKSLSKPTGQPLFVTENQLS